MPLAILSPSCASSRMPSEPGVTGTPLASAVARAVFLSPMVRMVSAEGPMNLISQDSQISTKRAFSERNPYPGWMASASVISAAAMMRSGLRYESLLGPGPMQTASSASWTCMESMSASE